MLPIQIEGKVVGIQEDPFNPMQMILTIEKKNGRRVEFVLEEWEIKRLLGEHN